MSLATAERIAALRSERDARLKALDGPWMRAIGQGNTAEATAIEAKRQQLRDIPAVISADISAIASPDQLLSYSPSWPVYP